MENNIQEIFVSALFSKDVIKKAKKLSKSSGKLLPIDYEDITFRLRKTNTGSVNLELFVQDQYGMYFKPIGFYEFGGFWGNVQRIYILKEFEETFIKIKGKLNNIDKVKYLSLLQNVYIALGSVEVGRTVTKMFNSPNYSENNYLDFSKRQIERLLVNGLKIVVKTSLGGALEAVYEDDNNYFNGEDMLVMFQNYNGISIHCSEKEYQNMMNKKLLSIFNRI